MEASSLQSNMGYSATEVNQGEQTSRKRQRKKVDRFVFLPDDILLDILERFPDAFLRYKAKYVCKRWFNIITNRILLDHASFILQNMRTFTARLVDISKEQQGMQVKRHYLDVPQIGIIRSWCNEWLLILVPNRRDFFYVYNLITKEGSYLPACDASCRGHYSPKCGITLSFDVVKGIYKAAHLFIGRTIECQILSLRRDVSHTTTRAFSKWKKIEVPYMNEGQNYIYGDPVMVQGRYMNWRIHYSNDVVSVDMVKEEVCIISLPGSDDRGFYFCSLFVMGGFLALFDGVSREKIEIWVLKDFHKVKWEKLQSITDRYRDFGVYPGKVINYRIYGMISKRYLILKSFCGMYSYDLKFGIVKKLDIHIQYAQFRSDECCVAHTRAPSLK